MMHAGELAQQLRSTEQEFNLFCASLSRDQFFYCPENKWSPAQQVKHLVKATDMARLAFTLPRFIVRWMGGRPNRDSRTFDELVARYRQKLEQGGRASGRYIPKPVPERYGKEKLLNRFTKSMLKLAASLEKKGVDQMLDRYIVPHPLLGKITLRELCYFTIYHTHHHLASIKKLAAAG